MQRTVICPSRSSGFHQPVFMRAPYDDVSITSVTSSVVCAEKPNVKLVEETLRAIVESAPKGLGAMIEHIASLSTVVVREQFERQLADGVSLWKAADFKWSPAPELCEALSENRLLSNVETSLASGWFENYVLQVKSLRHAHLRLIAKKGCDLHGNRHFASHRTPEDDPNMIGRRAAANEILEEVDWTAHAHDLLRNAETAIGETAKNARASLVVATYVKDWTLSKNSYNVLTRLYTEQLTETLRETAKHKFKELEIAVDVRPIQTTTTTDRTNATAMERLFRQPVLKEDSAEFEGTSVILADDHINTGACLAAMHSVVRKGGGRVIGISTYSRNEAVDSLRASQDILGLFQGVASPEQINGALSEAGIGFETLTPREALTLAAALLDGRKEEERVRFASVYRAHGPKGERPIMAGIDDCIEAVLLRPPREIGVIKDMISQGIRETRYMFRPILFDLDDTLIDSADYYYRVYEHLFEVVERCLGLPRPKRDFRQKGAEKSDAYIAREYGRENLERVAALRTKVLLGDEIHPKPLPGAFELLGYICERKIPLCIVSNTPQDILDRIVQKLFRSAGLNIQLVVGDAGKPHPGGLLKALRLLETKGIDTCHALYIGDDPDRDVEAGAEAGLETLIIPRKKVVGRRHFTTLPSLKAVLAFLKTGKLSTADIRTPPYIRREGYGDRPLEETEIITSGTCATEAPSEGSLDLKAAFSLAQREFHDLRRIAKYGVNLRNEGPCTRQEQLAACEKVLYGFTACDGTSVHGLLTPSMIERLAGKVERYVARSWKGRAGANDALTIHVPARTVRPKTKVENELLLAAHRAIIQELSDYLGRNPFPDIKIRFNGVDRVLIGEALHLVVDRDEGMENTRISCLSDHDPCKTVQARRTESNGLSRVFQQPIFDCRAFKQGDVVILTDDCAQSCSALITCDQALRNRGVNVVAYAALSSLPESRNLRAAPSVIDKFDEAIAFAASNHVEKMPGSDYSNAYEEFQRSVNHIFGLIGLSKETLSNREALTIMAFFIDGTKAGQLDWFNSVAFIAGADPELPDRDDQSPFFQARRPFMSPNELAVMVDRQVPKYCVSGV